MGRPACHSFARREPSPIEIKSITGMTRRRPFEWAVFLLNLLCVTNKPLKGSHDISLRGIERCDKKQAEKYNSRLEHKSVQHIKPIFFSTMMLLQLIKKTTFHDAYKSVSAMGL